MNRREILVASHRRIKTSDASSRDRIEPRGRQVVSETPMSVGVLPKLSGSTDSERDRGKVTPSSSSDGLLPIRPWQTPSRPFPHQPAIDHAINQARARARAIPDKDTREHVLDVLGSTDTFLRGVEDAGWWTSSMLLRHFLAGSGKPVVVPPTVLKDFAPAKVAVRGVLQHFEDWFMANDEDIKDSRYGWPTLDLEDGERRVVGGPDAAPGSAVGDRVMWEKTMSGAGILDPDHLSDAQASFGGATVQGYGRFVLERHDNVVTISGYIDLLVSDEYTFDSEDIFNPGFRHLEPAGVARSFELKTTPWRVPYYVRVLLDDDGHPVNMQTQAGDASIPAMPR